MTQRRRAIRAEDKQARRQQILDTALALFAAGAYQDITMNQVADSAGLAKGTLYLYFKTREELFLALLERMLDDWFQTMDQALSADDAPLSPQALVEAMAASLAPRPQLLRLVALLHVVLERNVEFDAALAFKRGLAQRSRRTGALLERRLGFLAPGEGLKLLQRVHALIIGLQQQAEPAPTIRRALAEPDLADFRIDFAAEFLTTVQALVQGLAMHRS